MLPHGYTAPSVRKNAFSCPHCFTYTTQHWSHLRASAIHSIPELTATRQRNFLNSDPKLQDYMRTAWIELFDTIEEGGILIHRKLETKEASTSPVSNLFISDCFHCKKVAIWVREKMIFPSTTGSHPIPPNLPDNIRSDFSEAAQILESSPRGAAALLRLVIEKLCNHILGKKAPSIDDAISQLVTKGLSTEAQRALDYVRVIGNLAVHPGNLDIQDDRETVETLFHLIGFIVDEMITRPAKLSALYNSLPPNKLKAIEERDKKAKAKRSDLPHT